MCRRYTLTTPAGTLAAHFGLLPIPDLPPRYNVAPAQPVATVRQVGDGRELVALRWGLIPSWATDPQMADNLINAPAAAVPDHPAFRRAFERRRCLIPADGFYEWKTSAGGQQPHHIRRKDRAPVAFAGLWEWWPSPDGEVVETCAIITTTANALMWHLHDRMPAILDPADYAAWLGPATPAERLAALLVPYSAEELEVTAVSTRVNSPKHEGPDCLAPAP